MSPVIRKLVPLFCFLISVSACLNLKQPRNKIDYYILEYAPPRLTKPEPLPVIIKIDRFSAAPLYNTNRIVFRDKSFKRDAYVYHRWRVNPGGGGGGG